MLHLVYRSRFKPSGCPPLLFFLLFLSLALVGILESGVDFEDVSSLTFIPEHSGDDLLPIRLSECAARYFEANYESSLRATRSVEREMANLRHVGVDHVYIIHYSPLKYRRGNLSAILRPHGVVGEWVLGFDKELLNASTDRCFHYYNPREHTGAKSTRYAKSGMFSVSLGLAQRSVLIKHFSAFYDAYRHNYKTVLVLEDDVLLRVGFVGQLGEVLRETPRGFDAIFLGGCMRLYSWRKKFRTVPISKHVYRKQSSRCAHAFVLSQTGVRKLLRSLPLTEPIDFQMNLAMREENMTVYWIEPWMAVQGNFGESTCVTKTDLNATSCRFSTLRRYTRSFDVRHVNDTTVLRRWGDVQEMRGIR